MDEKEYTTPAEAVSEQVGKNFESGAEPKYAPPPAQLPEPVVADGPSATVESVERQPEKAADLPESQKVVYSDPQVAQATEQIRQPVLNSDYDPVPTPSKTSPAVIQQPEPAAAGPSVNSTPIELSRSTAAEVSQHPVASYDAPNGFSQETQASVAGELPQNPEQPVSKTEQFDPAPIVGAISDLIAEVKGLREDLGKQKTEEAREQPAEKMEVVVEQKAPINKPVESPVQKPVERPVFTPEPVRKPSQDSLQKPVQTAPQQRPVQQTAPRPQPQQQQPRQPVQQQQPQTQQADTSDAPQKAQKTADDLQKLLSSNQRQMGQVVSLLEQMSTMIEQSLRQASQNEEMISKLMEFQQGTRNKAMGSGWRR